MRVMGLDVGERIIGIAISDELGITAQPVDRIVRRNKRVDMEKLAEVRDQYGVSEVVVGLPRRTDGQIGPEAESVLEFVSEVADNLSLPVRTWDERYTTVIANQALSDANVPKRKRRALVDEVAAGVILQGYLETLTASDRCEV